MRLTRFAATVAHLLCSPSAAPALADGGIPAAFS